MRILALGSRIFAEWPLPTATSDVAPTELGAFRGRRGYKDFAPTELGVFRGSRSYKDFAPTELGAFRGWRGYKDFAPTELVGKRLVDQNAEQTTTTDIVVESSKSSL